MGLKKRSTQMTANTLSRATNASVNLNGPVNEFRHLVMSWDDWQEGMDVVVRHLKQKDLPAFVFPEGDTLCLAITVHVAVMIGVCFIYCALLRQDMVAWTLAAKLNVLVYPMAAHGLGNCDALESCWFSMTHMCRLHQRLKGFAAMFK